MKLNETERYTTTTPRARKGSRVKRRVNRVRARRTRIARRRRCALGRARGDIMRVEELVRAVENG